MSFSSDVKEELSRQIDGSRHCRIAELTAIVTMCGKVSISTRDRMKVRIQTENIYVARKYAALLYRIFHITAEVSVRIHGIRGQNRSYLVAVNSHEEALLILETTGLMKKQYDVTEQMSPDENEITQRICCRRAYIRGAFLVSGSISDPQRSYHFEIVCADPEKAVQLREMIGSFHLDAKVVERKKHYVVYLKEGAQIVDALNVMEAHRALMELENIRILREISNSVNRRVNCETANLNKTVGAAVRQVEDIQYLQKTTGLTGLPDHLAVMAQLRLDYQDATLKELGEMLDPPVGKSGVNHRLRKLSELAERIRIERGEICRK